MRRLAGALVVLGLVTLHATPLESKTRADVTPPAPYTGPTRDPWAWTRALPVPVAPVAVEAPRTPPPPRVRATGDAWACIRWHESRGNYSAVNPNGHFGAYQFLQSTWDGTAARHGRDDLVGVRPDEATPADQDQMAVWLQSDSGWGQWSARGACGL